MKKTPHMSVPQSIDPDRGRPQLDSEPGSYQKPNSLLRRFFPVGVATLLAAGFVALTAKAAPPAAPQGMITARVYMGTGTGNTSVATLTNFAKFPNSPILTYHPTYFESWATGDINVAPLGDYADGYGDQLMGYFYAPTNGNYTF